jgi:SHS family lactate transporter-like MFS transporter
MAMTSVQRNVVIAGFLGWTLDAFDFFILVLRAKAIAAEFHVGREDVVFAVTLTLLARPGWRLRVRPAGRPLRPPARC